MQPMPFRLSFRGIGGENQRVIPLTPLLQQPL
jgi:hypothetical protein